MVLHNCSDTAFVHAAAGRCPQKHQRQGHEPVGSPGPHTPLDPPNLAVFLPFAFAAFAYPRWPPARRKLGGLSVCLLMSCCKLLSSAALSSSPPVVAGFWS